MSVCAAAGCSNMSGREKDGKWITQHGFPLKKLLKQGVHYLGRRDIPSVLSVVYSRH